MEQLIKHWKDTVDMYSRQLEMFAGGLRTHSDRTDTTSETIEHIKRWRSELQQLIEEYSGPNA